MFQWLTCLGWMGVSVGWCQCRLVSVWMGVTVDGCQCGLRLLWMGVTVG